MSSKLFSIDLRYVPPQYRWMIKDSVSASKARSPCTLNESVVLEDSALIDESHEFVMLTSAASIPLLFGHGISPREDYSQAYAVFIFKDRHKTARITTPTHSGYNEERFEMETGPTLLLVIRSEALELYNEIIALIRRCIEGHSRHYGGRFFKLLGAKGIGKSFVLFLVAAQLRLDAQAAFKLSSAPNRPDSLDELGRYIPSKPFYLLYVQSTKRFGETDFVRDLLWAFDDHPDIRVFVEKYRRPFRYLKVLVDIIKDIVEASHSVLVLIVDQLNELNKANTAVGEVVPDHRLDNQINFMYHFLCDLKSALPKEMIALCGQSSNNHRSVLQMFDDYQNKYLPSAKIAPQDFLPFLSIHAEEIVKHTMTEQVKLLYDSEGRLLPEVMVRSDVIEAIEAACSFVPLHLNSLFKFLDKRQRQPMGHRSGEDPARPVFITDSLEEFLTEQYAKMRSRHDDWLKEYHSDNKAYTLRNMGAKMCLSDAEVAMDYSLVNIEWDRHTFISPQAYQVYLDSLFEHNKGELGSPHEILCRYWQTASGDAALQGTLLERLVANMLLSMDGGILDLQLQGTFYDKPNEIRSFEFYFDKALEFETLSIRNKMADLDKTARIVFVPRSQHFPLFDVILVDVPSRVIVGLQITVSDLAHHNARTKERGTQPDSRARKLIGSLLDGLGSKFPGEQFYFFEVFATTQQPRAASMSAKFGRQDFVYHLFETHDVQDFGKASFTTLTSKFNGLIRKRSTVPPDMTILQSLLKPFELSPFPTKTPRGRSRSSSTPGRRVTRLAPSSSPSGTRPKRTK